MPPMKKGSSMEYPNKRSNNTSSSTKSINEAGIIYKNGTFPMGRRVTHNNVVAIYVMTNRENQSNLLSLQTVYETYFRKRE